MAFWIFVCFGFLSLLKIISFQFRLHGYRAAVKPTVLISDLAGAKKKTSSAYNPTGLLQYSFTWGSHTSKSKLSMISMSFQEALRLALKATNGLFFVAYKTTAI